MGPNNISEQQPNRESNQSEMDRLAQQTVQEILNKLHAIDASEASPQEKARQKSEITSDVLNEYRQTQRTLENLGEAGKSGEGNEQQQKNIQKERQNLRQALIKITTLADNDVPVTENIKAQRILRELSKTPPTDTETVAIQDALGEYLLGARASYPAAEDRP